MRVTAAVVHYRHPQDTVGCIAALRQAAAADRVEMEIVLADNSERGEAAALGELADRYIALPGNPGYGAAVNRALADCSSERLLITNPDVRLLPASPGAPVRGALAVLLAALDDERVGVAGPRFYWDDERRFLLPPAAEGTLVAELGAIAAARHRGWARRRSRRDREVALRSWQGAVLPLDVPMLSGALLALRADVWQRVGGFDERFPLYFEETDWLRRARGAGLRLRWEPRAEAVHYFNQAAGENPERSRALYQLSAERYFRKHYGALGAAARRWLASPPPASKLPGLTAAEPGGAPRIPAAAPCLVEVSPQASFVPAAGAFFDVAAPALPESLWCRLQPGLYFLRASRWPGLEPLGEWSFERPRPTAGASA